jgi:hypothetical protein
MDKRGILNVTLTLAENASEPIPKCPRNSVDAGNFTAGRDDSFEIRGAMSPANTSVVSDASHVNTLCWTPFVPE